MVGEESNKVHNFKLIIENEKIIVPALIMLGTILRLLRIATREIAYDDAFSYFLSLKDFKTIVEGTVADTMPPLYYFVLHLFSLINHEIWFLRLLNVFLSIAIFLVVYVFVREMYGKGSGYLTLLLTAISPFLIYHSQELRMYNFLLLGQLGYLFGLFMLSKNQDKFLKYFLITVFFGTMALYSHSLAIMGLLTCNLIFLSKMNKKYLYQQILILATLAVLFLPWAIYLPQQIDKVQTAFWTPRPGILEIIQAIVTLFGFAPMPIYWMALVIILMAQIFAIVMLWTFQQKNTLLFVLVGIGFGIPVLLFITSYLTRPVFVPRIFILSTVIAYILISRFVNVNKQKVIGKVVLGSMLLVSLISLPYYYKFESFPRSSFRQAVNFLAANMDKNAGILHDNKLSFFPMSFYNTESDQNYLSDPKGNANDTLAPHSQKAMGFLAWDGIRESALPQELFFVTFLQSEFEYEQIGQTNPNLKKLQEYYVHEDRPVLIGDIKIYRFEQLK